MKLGWSFEFIDLLNEWSPSPAMEKFTFKRDVIVFRLCDFHMIRPEL